jgi:hypothetical protein
MYYHQDNQGESSTTQSIGPFDYTTGNKGYSGQGQQIGNTYYYHDNKKKSNLMDAEEK